MTHGCTQEPVLTTLHCSPNRCRLRPCCLYSQSPWTHPCGTAQGAAPVPVLLAASPGSHRFPPNTRAGPGSPRFTTVTSARSAVPVPRSAPCAPRWAGPSLDGRAPLSPVANQRFGSLPDQKSPVVKLAMSSVHQNCLKVALLVLEWEKREQRSADCWPQKRGLEPRARGASLELA